MEEVTQEMLKIKSKKMPTVIDVQRYVRYLVNVRKYDKESIYEDVPHWKKEDVDKAFKEVERENSKPRPQRYYVSLKDPLEGDR